MRAASYSRSRSRLALEAQQREIDDYCHSRGWEIVAKFADEANISGTDNSLDRLALRQVLHDARTRTFDVIVVHRLDRFSRDPRTLAEAVEKLAGFGVGIVSVSEGIDASVPDGQQILSKHADKTQINIETGRFA